MNAIKYYELSIWVQKETATDWAETYTHKIVNGTRPHSPIANTISRKDNFYNSLYRLQHVGNQKQDVLMASYTLEEAAYRIEQGLRWLKWRIWSNLINAVRTSRFNRVYREIVVNKKCNLNTKFKSHNACTNLIRWTFEMKFPKIDRSIWTAMQGKNTSLINKTRRN